MIKIFKLLSLYKLLLFAILMIIATENVFPQDELVFYNSSERKFILDCFTTAREFVARNELDSAIYYNKMVLNMYLAAKDIRGITKVQNYIARLFQRKFENDSTLAYLNAGLALTNNSPVYQTEEGELYNTLGIFYLNLGDYANAIIYLKLALNIRLGFKIINQKLIVNSYLQLGDIQLDLGNYDNAIYYYRQALQKQFTRPGGINAYYIASNYYYIGKTFLKKNNISEAKKNFLIGFSYSKLPIIYQDMGMLFILEKNFAAADTSLSKALELRLRELGEKHFFTSQCYYALAELYRAKKDYLKAYEYYTDALNSCIKSDEEKFFSIQNHNFNDVISVKDFLTSLKGKVEMIMELAKKDSAEARLLYAKKMLVFSISFLSAIQKYYLFDDSKLKLRELADEIMNLGVETCYEIYKITGDKKYVSQAFIFSETKRNSVLNESKAKREAMRELNIPDSLVNTELKLKLKLNQLLNSAKDDLNNDIIDKTAFRENLILSTVNAYDSLLSAIKRDYPKYASLASSEEKVTLYQIRKRFNDDVAVEYTVTKDKIFIFCINKESITLIKKTKKKSFDRTLKVYRNSLKKIEKKSYLSTAKELYNELILPVEREIASKKKLTIIPCSELNLIPFEALISPNGSWLIENISIEYLGSSSYYKKNQKESSDNYPFYIIAFAPSYDNQKDYFPLKNDEEINDISLTLKKHNLRDSLFEGNNANKENLFNSATKSKILHIAAHSFADTLNEGKSGIVFGENVLTAAEIIANEFNNDLVVLSSCEGGNGKTVSGEGVLSLSRNFLRAGVNNLIVALWRVPDRQTKIFMIEFYKQLIKDNNYADALSRTKRELIKNKLFNFPNTWAAFVLMK